MRKLISYTSYLFFVFLSFFPFSILLFFSDLVYLLVYYILRYRRSVVRTNLTNSFPEKSLNELVCIEKEFYKHLCDSFFETIKVLNMSEEEMKRRMIFHSDDLVKKYEKEGRSIILVFGHYCNWEWTTSYALHTDLFVGGLYKPLHNKVFDSMFKKIRSRFGAHTIAKDTALRKMVSLKKSKEQSLIAFIGDQTPKKKDIHYWTEFLHQETPIFLGAEKMAKLLDHVVVFAHLRKVKRACYEVDFTLISDKAKEEEEFFITETHTRILETIIKEEPSYWLWTHKRWKHKR